MGRKAFRKLVQAIRRWGLMGTALLLDGTSPALDAYSAENCLIFISSVIAGIEAPGLARFSVVTKSPLSQGIAESRCEGPFGTFLKGSGYDAIVIKGKSEQPCYLKIENGKLSFHSAEDLWGTSTWHTTKKLEEIHGQEELQVASIGQAGENLVRFASIVTDYSIQAMRMGTGAVMGSKNLKALVIKGKNRPAIFDPEGLARLSREFHETMLKNTLSLWQKNPLLPLTCQITIPHILGLKIIHPIFALRILIIIVTLTCLFTVGKKLVQVARMTV